MNNDQRAAWMLIDIRRNTPPRASLSAEAQAVYAGIDALLAALCTDDAQTRRWRVLLRLAYRVGVLVGRHRR